jgi:hypothetical protein
LNSNLLESRKYDIAKAYAQQSLDEALKIADDIWAMNACILLGQLDSKLTFSSQLASLLPSNFPFSESFLVRTKLFDTASSYFKRAEEYASSCRNKANIQLLKEGQHCIKIYMEKKAKEAATPRSSHHTKKRSSEDSFDDDFDDYVEPLTAYH